MIYQAAQCRIARCPFLESQQIVNLRGSGGHEGLDQERLEPDEISDDVQDNISPAYWRYLPALFAVLFFPELRLLQIFISSGTDLHSKFKPFFQFYFVHELPVLDVSILKLSYEVNVEFAQQISL